MDNGRVVYVNVLAEGSRITEPQVLTDEDIRLVARTWQRGETVFHTKIIGYETIKLGNDRHRCLFADVGAAKIILPIENAALRDSQRPMDLAGQWVSVVIEQADWGGVPTLLVNRVKALEILRGVNEKRVKVGQRAHGVVRLAFRGGYLMNVGGYEALLPRAFYDWDLDQNANVGEEFQVEIIPSKVEDRLVVNRRVLLPNPFSPSQVRMSRGAIVQANILYIRGFVYQVETQAGIKISVDPIHMREIRKPGDEVTVRVLGEKKQGYYGVFA